MEFAFKGNNYQLLVGYQKDKKLRLAFNDLAVKVFKLSFEVWYESGFWREKYIPYTLFEKDKAIANVSVNIMDFNTFGENKRYIQLGTVMTDENYRNKGLSRLLLEKVMDEWQTKCDFIYLFANSTALNFYPKLGFTAVREYEYFKKVKATKKSECIKLNMEEQVNREKLYDYAKNTKIFGKLSMQENADLVMFYCITFLSESVYFIPSIDAIAIAKINGHELHLLDVFSKSALNLDDVINALSDITINTVLLGFTPTETKPYEMRKINEVLKDDVLFIQTGRTYLFDENQLMFPLLSHA